MTSIDSRADRADLLRAVAVLCEAPGSTHPEVARSLGLEPPDPAEHTELFVHQLVPYASVYLDEQGKIGGDARDRIAGFWRALHLTPPAEPDHLASLLGLLATLSEAAAGESDTERRALLGHSRRALAWEHLVPWLTPYLTRVGELGSSPYRAWAAILAEVISEEAGEPMPAVPAHLHGAGAQDPDHLDDWLLVPVRSGLILTRSDLRRAAEDLGLGLRMGERAYILDALFRQNRSGMLVWLADEAERQVELWSEMGAPSVVRRHWTSRATGTASVLRRGAN